MFLAAALIELEVPDTGTLKAHRSLANALKDRIRRRFNVSVAEVGGQDTWQRAVLGLSVSSNDPVAARRVLERAVACVEGLTLEADE